MAAPVKQESLGFSRRECQTYNQLKQYLSGAMGTKSPIVLAKKITELQESGHLRRFVEREKALFVKN
jgi:hypothetical protein